MGITLLLISSITVFSAQDSANEIAAEMQAIPDLIIGNYSDGNLVASLLSHKMGVTEVKLMFICLDEVFAVDKLFLLLCCSAPLRMPWKKQNIQIPTYIGRSLTRSTTFHASSLPIY